MVRTTARLPKTPNRTSKKAGKNTAGSSKNQSTREDKEPIGYVKEEFERLTEWVDDNLDQLPDDFIAMALNYDLITNILTKERIRIVNHLRKHGPVTSLQELADALGRDRSAVSRDLVMLEHQLVEIKKNGRQKEIRAVDRPIIIY